MRSGVYRQNLKKGRETIPAATFMSHRKNDLGAQGENIAVRYLQNKGYRIVARNYRTRFGEIDIIAEQGPDLVFVEVKTRASGLFGSPLDSVDVNKQKQLSRVALDYMSRKSCQNRPARFDVVAILLKNRGFSREGDVAVELVRNAFDFCRGSW